jgi:molybdate transport system substrate-binding protein
LGRRLAPLIVAWLLLQAQTKPVGEVIVMTSGTYTAAHLELAPDFERSANITVTTATTSMGVGADAIPSRLKRGEPADVVIVADDAFDGLIKEGLVIAKSVALSSSVSGDYFTKELFPRLGIAEQMRAKTRRSGGERVGALIARGDAEIGFQQMSELLPIKEIEVVGPLPSEVQRVTIFTAGVAAHAKFPDAARLYVRFLASSAAAAAVARSGLELPTR